MQVQLDICRHIQSIFRIYAEETGDGQGQQAGKQSPPERLDSEVHSGETVHNATYSVVCLAGSWRSAGLSFHFYFAKRRDLRAA
jgi:hypothetical protein